MQERIFARKSAGITQKCRCGRINVAQTGQTSQRGGSRLRKSVISTRFARFSDFRPALPAPGIPLRPVFRPAGGLHATRARVTMAPGCQPLLGPHFSYRKLCNVQCVATIDISRTFRGPDRRILLIF